MGHPPLSGWPAPSSRTRKDTMHVYISGPITGLPDNNYPAFHAAEEGAQR